MKRIIFLFIVSVLLFFSTDSLIAQKCSDNIIYVNPKLVTDSGITIQKWIDINSTMVLCKNEGDEIIVDLGNFMDENDIPIWLKENSGYIDFEKSYKEIEDIHKLNPGDIIIDAAENEILYNKKYYDITYDFLKIYSSNQDIYKLPKSELYKNYKKVYKNLFKNIKMKNDDVFVKEEHNFSAPFLMSIIANRKIEEIDYENCYFKFTIINIKNDEKAVLKFTFKGENFYYDFSDEPGGSKIADLTKDIYENEKKLANTNDKKLENYIEQKKSELKKMKVRKVLKESL